MWFWITYLMPIHWCTICREKKLMWTIKHFLIREFPNEPTQYLKHLRFDVYNIDFFYKVMGVEGNEHNFQRHRVFFCSWLPQSSWEWLEDIESLLSWNSKQFPKNWLFWVCFWIFCWIQTVHRRCTACLKMAHKQQYLYNKIYIFYIFLNHFAFKFHNGIL